MSHVNFHLNLGVSAIVVYFDRQELEWDVRLLDDPKVRIFHCGEDYWLEHCGSRHPTLDEKLIATMKDAQALATSLGFAWHMYLDNDELIHSARGDLEFLNEEGGSEPALCLRPLEAVARCDSDDPFGSCLFKKPMAKNNGLMQRLVYGKKAAFFNRGLLGHSEGKSIYRLPNTFEDYGLHFPIRMGKPMAPRYAKQANLLHFDCANYAAWRRKWGLRLSSAGIVAGMRAQRQAQHDAIKAAFAAGQGEALYYSLFGLKPAQRLALSGVGLLKKVRVDETKFAGPISLAGLDDLDID